MSCKISIGDCARLIFTPFHLVLAISICSYAHLVANDILSYLERTYSFNVAKDIRLDAFSKIERLPLSYLDKKSSGDEAAEELEKLKLKINSIGYSIVTDRGDVRKENHYGKV